MRRGALLGAAGSIALVTVAARIVGFGRIAVLSRTLGTSCVGDTYQTANYVLNVVFEVVAGGALATLVVPVLAGFVSSGDRAAAARTASALLTWTVALLVPVAVLGALLAPLLMRGLLGDEPTCAGAVQTGSRMLVVFMPQVVLYGVGIVLAGVLQAHRRFLGPALAPLLSSLVVMTAYLLYASRGRVEQATDLSRPQELVLSVGTTLGVAVLSLGLLVPLRRLGLGLRPTFGFPPGIAARARDLAAGGVVGLLAQQLALVVALRLATGGRAGSVIVFTVATALFLLPWAVLAVPVATSAAPSMSVAVEQTDEQAYADVVSRSLRTVVLAMAGAAAVLAVAALPAAEVLVRGAPGVESSSELARATAAFAPGLLGYGLVALLTRALYARAEVRRTAVSTAAGWGAVAVADLLLVAAFPDAERVVLLGVGNTLGVTLAAVLLLLAVRRSAGSQVLLGLGRSASAAAAGALVAVGAGALVPDLGPALLTGAVAALVAAAAYLLVARLLDADGVRELRRA